MTHRTPHGRGAKGPEELREQIERTRSRLGHGVGESAAKADLKERALARAADLRDKAGAMTVQLRGSAAQAGHAVQGRAAHAGRAVQGRAAHAGRAVQGRAAHAGHAVQARAARAERTVEQRAPLPVRSAVRFGMRHPRPVLFVGVTGTAIVWTGVRWYGRHRRH
ncbi:DUF3618 domain-containing protein [Streptomyces sp. NPDC086549]|uniref:DUF3618 domain-containing protein n=1 Tax=Streptomyces sp. NPDC086549 TaxID=3365752 RepID=UPI0038027928